MIIPVLMLPVLVSLASPVSGTVPYLNVNPSCEGAASMVVESKDKLKSCLDSEHATRDQLATEWQKFSPADRASCTATAKIGDEPTYTELITCLEVLQQVEQEKTESRQAIEVKPAGSRINLAGLLAY